MASYTQWSQLTAHIALLIFASCVLIPLCINFHQFGNHCLLFTGGEYLQDNGDFDPQWSSAGYCLYSIILSAVIILIALVQIVRISINITNNEEGCFFALFVESLIATFMILMVILDALFITGGFSYWCSSVTSRFPSCETADNAMEFSDQSISARGFMLQMGTAQYGIWASFLCWITLLVLSSRKLLLHHERDKMMSSMARERSRYRNLAS